MPPVSDAALKHGMAADEVAAAATRLPAPTHVDFDPANYGSYAMACRKLLATAQRAPPAAGASSAGPSSEALELRASFEAAARYGTRDPARLWPTLAARGRGGGGGGGGPAGALPRCGGRAAALPRRHAGRVAAAGARRALGAASRARCRKQRRRGAGAVAAEARRRRRAGR